MAINKVTTDVIDLSGNTGGLVWAKGATGDQPLPVDSVAGDMRENTTTGKTEVFNGTEWRNLKEAATPIIVDFLVVAGGGGGGAAGAGAGAGGAGGLRTSFTNTSTLNGHNETALSLFSGVSYDIEVGIPGAAGTGTGYGNDGQVGGNSEFNGIISTGGGFGSAGPTAAGTGGSGGGGAGGYGGVGAAAVTSPVTQGYAGGNGLQVYPSPQDSYAGGGGGGAGSLGLNAFGGIANENGGNGGDGLEVNIIGGTGNFYAGGGGGGAGYRDPSPNGGIGGSSIGGNGGTNTVAGGAGQINTGSGGGGGGGLAAGQPGGGNGQNGGSGGYGIVILRYPSSYSVTVGVGLSTGVLNGTVSGGTDKYTTFTAGTGTITFS